MSQFEEQDYTSKFDIKLWIRALRFLKGCKKATIWFLIINTLAAIGVAITPMMNMIAIDRFAVEGTLDGIGYLILGFGALGFFIAWTFYKSIDLAAVLEVTVVHDMRMAAFKQLQKLSFSYYDTTPVGWIMTRLTSDAQRLGDVIAWNLVDMSFQIFIIIFAMVSMFILNVRMALIAIALMPIFFFVSFFFQKRMLKNQREVRKVNSKITGAYNEGITGAKTTKTLVRERKNFDEFDELTTSMKKTSIRAIRLSALYGPIIAFMGTASIALVIFTSEGAITENLITIGTLSVFISYITMLFQEIQQMAEVVLAMQSAQAAAERTITLIDTEEEIRDTDEVVEKYGTTFHPKYENWEKLVGNIKFEDVSFAYKTGEPVLKSFNLDVKAGEKIALVGPTGAGKSTIVNLLCRFYEPVSGEILIDEKDYKQRSQLWLHANIGYVLQNPHLFSGTIKENIRYGKLDATDEEIIEVAKKVNAYDFIMNLEKGFDTDVGEGGNRLSSGEKQLISFARAIIKNPQIFILDEATSNIDTETEKTIQQAIFNILKGRTSFIVAHRLSTIRSCDKILVIEDGKIAEMGSHRELMRQKGIYFNLYTNQFTQEEAQKLLNA